MDRLFTVFWFAGPFILLIERSPADIWLSIIAISFVVRSFLIKDSSWLGFFWVRAAFAFWAICIISALLSDDWMYSFGEIIIWFRFPLFAMAIAFWLGKDRRLLNLMLLSTAIGLAFMCVILALELTIEGAQPRLSWPYDDLVSGNYLAKVGLPVVVVLMALTNSLSNRVALISGVISMVILGMTLMTGERINFLTIACGGFLAALIWQPKWKSIVVLLITVSLSMGSLFWVFPDVANRFVLAFISHFPTSAESEYFRAIIPGWYVFEQAPLLGIGPGNYRYMCTEIVDVKLGLDCHNHPHNFYFQLLAETGLAGFFLGLVFFGSLIYSCFRVGWQKRDDVFVATAWIIPFALFWPIRSSADFFGQWNNIFMWSSLALSISAVSNHPLMLNKLKKALK